MTQIIFDAQTGEKITVEVVDEPIATEQTAPTQEDRLSSLEETMLYIIMGGGI